MREIKFRVWNKTRQVMSYDVTLYANGWVECVFVDGSENKYPPHIAKEFLKIMQYTGLKDKNFKEIYEKDIVKYKDCNKEHISKVIQDFRLGTGHYIKSPGIGFYSINERTIKDLEIKVIGNVFEDSHLLEEQNG